MAKRLAEILSEDFDTGGISSHKKKFYIRKIDKSSYGRFRYNSGKQNYVRVGGKYTDKREAEQAAKLST